MASPGAARRAAALLAALLLAACVGPGPAERREQALQSARAAGFVPAVFFIDDLPLLALQRQTGDATLLRLYIEGDGPPWPGPYMPPADPTPEHPLALSLATADPHSRVLYLGRPCQFVSAPACDVRWWTGRRFAPGIVAGYRRLIDAIKAGSRVEGIALVGYSGGGVLAALIAAGRDDVVELQTVAAPLDTRAWIAHHDLSTLEGDNPADHSERLGRIAQRHWVGASDRVVPPAILAGYGTRIGLPQSIVILPGQDHECCWSRLWPQLVREAVAR